MMINKSFFYSVVIVMFSHGVSALANCDYDDFPVMEEMSVQSVMDDAHYNNRPMMVRNFVADASYQSVVDYYHRVWDKQYDDTGFGVWHQITTVTDDCMMTVQIALREGSPSSGRLVISNPPAGSANDIVGEDIIAPTDSDVVSDLVTHDGPKKGRVTMLSTGGSTSEVAHFYLSEMANNGWSLERKFVEQESRVLAFRKGLNISNILIIPAGTMTQVLINEEIIK